MPDTDSLSIEKRPARCGVLLCNLGTPDAPEPSAVRRYLAEFLSDPRVVEIPSVLWKPVLHAFVLTRRPRESAEKYRKVWMGEQGSPLLFYSRRQGELLRQRLAQQGAEGIDVQVGMRYGSPSMKEIMAAWHAQGIEQMLLLPLYPQYSATTTASVIDQAYRWASQQRNVPALRIVKHYFRDNGYLEALEQQVLAHWQQHGRPEKLIMSYHGIPQRNIDKGDPYQQQCLQTSHLLAVRLGLSEQQYLVTFQSRFGPDKWLQPYTQPTVEQLARDGVRVIDVICPGFSSDCLETLEEINMEVRHAFTANGGREFRYIPCLNEQPGWIAALSETVKENLAGW